MTRLLLEQMREIGPVKIAVITEVRVDVRASSLGVGGHGEKKPRFVLLEDGVELEAFDPNGARVTLADLEAVCPELLDAFRKGAAPASSN